MIVSHARRFIFLKTQKTGGSSVELALSEICGPEDVITPLPAEDEALRTGRGPQNCEIAAGRRPWWSGPARLVGVSDRRAGAVFSEHMNAKQVRRAVGPDVFDRYLKATIVRNPWDREVSLYFWHTRGMDRPPSFDEFVRRRLSRPERKTWEIYAIGDRCVADVVMRYERLDEDFTAFLQRVGHDGTLTLPRAKGAYRPEKKRDYRELYTAETAEIVRDRYAREIAYFGMTFDGEAAAAT